MKAGNPLRNVFYIVICENSAAEICLEHGQNRLVIACFKQNMGLKAGIREDPVHKSPHGRTLVHDNKGFVP